MQHFFLLWLCWMFCASCTEQFGFSIQVGCSQWSWRQLINQLNQTVCLYFNIFQVEPSKKNSPIAYRSWDFQAQRLGEWVWRPGVGVVGWSEVFDWQTRPKGLEGTTPVGEKHSHWQTHAPTSHLLAELEWWISKLHGVCQSGIMHDNTWRNNRWVLKGEPRILWIYSKNLKQLVNLI